MLRVDMGGLGATTRAGGAVRVLLQGRRMADALTLVAPLAPRCATSHMEVLCIWALVVK